MAHTATATATATATGEDFSKWRKFFWPIYAFELKKIIPMLLMFFFITFNYSLLRNLKDTLVVNAAKDLGLQSGAEVIPILKFAFVIPFAILFMLFYSKLSNFLTRKNLFYVGILPFPLFFLVFALILYPAEAYLHPTDFGLAVLAKLPFQTGAIKGLVAAFTNWSFSLFYVFAELWGSVVLSLLFWGFANDITRVSEAKRFYALLGIGANFSLLAAGPLVKMAANLHLPNIEDPFAMTIHFLCAIAVCSAIIVMGLYCWINKYVLSDPRFYNPDEAQPKKSKPKMSLIQSFAFLARSKYLSLITVLVLAYGISIVLIEATWKGQLGLYFPTRNEYLAFLGDYTFAMGLTTIFMMLFVSGQIVRKFGWGVAAAITPFVLLITGIAFSGFVTFKGDLAGFLAEFGTTPLLLAVIFGTIQNVMSKASKYSLFDPTKEMTYIPLDRESKVKGKAAIDVVGARLGKAGGSLAVFVLLLFLPNIEKITPYAGILIIIVMICWLLAVKALNKEFSKEQADSLMQ